MIIIPVSMKPVFFVLSQMKIMIINITIKNNFNNNDNKILFRGLSEKN